MVLYGIWLIDANSGLLLSHITVPGFTFNPDLFSGFIAASSDFAAEASGGKLSTIALGNFKLLIRRGRILLKVLAVGARDSEARYDQFFRLLENRVDPFLADLHREPDGFKAVTIEFRKQLLEIITQELGNFATRKAPSDLSDLAVLHEAGARTLIQSLLKSQCAELSPELATTKIGYSYPLASSITGLDGEETLRLLERLADYGLLLAEPTDTALACPKCNSLHLHPHILCPNCQTPALPVELYEHLSCGHINKTPETTERFTCERCGVDGENEHEFRLFRGYQCSQCYSSFKQPQMIFVCHSCQSVTEPEGAGISLLKKYVLNPALISELEFLLSNDARSKETKTRSEKKKDIERDVPKSQSTLGIRSSFSEPLLEINLQQVSTPTIPKPLPNPADTVSANPADTIEKKVTSDEAHLIGDLKQLEASLKEGLITEAEYDRNFVRLKLELRRLRSQNGL
ncbi:MAG: hypothetical protein ACFFD8_05225 [Candidatus Thorarchaeota archaeon]